jgi:hypothetical protein
MSKRKILSLTSIPYSSFEIINKCQYKAKGRTAL